MDSIDRVLVPMDDSEMATRALRYALEVYSDAEITVLTVVGEPSSMMGEATALALADDPTEAANEYATAILEGARAVADEVDRDIMTRVRIGHPARAIINEAEEYDTVVVGTHGGKIADRLLIGNVAEAVFRRSPVSVTVVR